MILRGIQREHGQPTRQKLPITQQILRSIKTQLNLNLSADITFWAACLVAFFSFFRKSNLLPPSAAGFDKNCHLRRKDVILCSWGVVLVVRWSKTIQFRQKRLLIPLPKLPIQIYVRCQPCTKPSSKPHPQIPRAQRLCTLRELNFFRTHTAHLQRS